MAGLTVIEASKLLGKSRAHIYTLVKSGKLELDDDNNITLESIQHYKNNPPKVGRPSGTFKRRKENG